MNHSLVKISGLGYQKPWVSLKDWPCEHGRKDGSPITVIGMLWANHLHIPKINDYETFKEKERPIPFTDDLWREITDTDWMLEYQNHDST